MSFDLDDLFKKNKHYRKHDNQHGYRYETKDDHAYEYRVKSSDQFQKILGTLMNDKKLLMLVVIAAFFLLITVIIVLVLALPFFLQLLGTLSKGGLKGIIDTLWLGIGK